MILKKPYAFLIKYFKLINLILAFFSVYITYKTYNIVIFFHDYIMHNYSGNYFIGFYESYVSSMLFLVLILTIIGVLAIVLLLIYKNKPSKIYLMSIVNSIILIVFFYIIKNVMITLEVDVISAETSRIYRDVSLLLLIPQVFFIISFLIRGLGLNIKKFNFQADLKELEISEKDNEEVEFTIKQDALNLKRNIRKVSREFKYYIRENKFMVIIAVLVIVLIFGILIYNNLPERVDEEYKQGDYFYINNLKYNIKDSIITNLNYSGDVIDNETYYIVNKLYVENVGEDAEVIDYNDFRLEIDGKYIYPLIDKGINFIDYAEQNIGKKIESKSKKEISLIFEINNEEVKNKNKFKIKISNGQAIQNKINVGKYNYISIRPVVIDESKIINKINIGENCSLKNSNLGDTNFTISNLKITNNYIYDYEFCQNDLCNTYKGVINLDYTDKNKTLMVFDYEYKISDSAPFSKVSKDFNVFLKTFGKIKYIDDNKTVYKDIDILTPKNLTNKVVLEVTNEISSKENLYLSIIIRNKEYEIKIK